MFGAVGWGIGTAIGLSVAAPSKPVICIMDAGARLMHGQELTVVNAHNLNITFIVLNDSPLGMGKHAQRVEGATDLANKLLTVTFSAVAAAYGVSAVKIKSDHQMEMPIVSTKPFLYDIAIDPAAVLAIHDPLALLIGANASGSINTVFENNRPFAPVKKNKGSLVFAEEELNCITHGLLDAIPRAVNDMGHADSETSAMLQRYLKCWARIVDKIAKHLTEH